MGRPTPEQLENFVLRITGKQNVRGPAADRMKKNHGLEGFGDPGVFDCDDRAELLKREVEKHGYTAATKVQRSVKGLGAHRYLAVYDADGTEHPLLKKAKDY
jgi:hypothetical protein